MENVMNRLQSRAELKAAALDRLSGQWGISIGVTLVYYLIIGIASNVIPRNYAELVGIFLGGPLLLGLTTFFVRLIRAQAPNFSFLFSGFQRYWVAVAATVIVTVFTFLWTLLLIIPGIIASLRYSQTYFILQDHPELTAWQAFQQSKEMMRGNKGRLFVLYLSFIGWGLLSILTLGIGFLWLMPYVMATSASFYENLKSSGASN